MKYWVLLIFVALFLVWFIRYRYPRNNQNNQIIVETLSENDIELIWMAPFWSRSGYGSEALSYVLPLSKMFILIPDYF